jgi:hypothetical protein
MEDGSYKVKSENYDRLMPLEVHLNTEFGNDVFKYARKICKPLNWHPFEPRVVEHENLWPGRKLRILFYPGNELWTTAWVKSWTEATVGIPGKMRDEVEWLICKAKILWI